MQQIDEIFKLLYKLKDIKKEELIIDKDDEFLIKNYHKLYDMKKICSKKLYRKLVINFSINCQLPIYKGIGIITTEIKNKYN